MLDNGGTSYGASCARLVTDRALADIAEIAVRDLAGAVRCGAVRPRAGHSLVHGELGPDHVLLDVCGRPALIDVEGLMYFDAEWVGRVATTTVS
ncbi:hypothetical protein AB0L75_38405 [Streptomyces sp. NPDC052101]|uniref:hypothetical protein n=1 Tax=Streptomyces sp. NPDC052101 TaxID=3155763 RepID=UPI0034339FA5